MKKKSIAFLLASIMITTMSACGMPDKVSAADIDPSDVIVVSEDRVPGAATPETDKDAEKSKEAKWENFKSNDGWTVTYDANVIAVEDNTDPADEICFNYTGEQAGTNCLVITYVKDKLPDKVIEEIKSAQENGTETEVTGGYFPGAKNAWGYWIDFKYPEEGSGLRQSYVIGEYNGGTLEFMFLTHKSGDDELDMASSDAIAMIIDSIEYEDFKPQSMYEKIPGTYTQKINEELDGTEYTFEYKLTLDEDHTGLMSIQDDMKIFWDDKIIQAEDGSFKYSYTLEGDKLTIDYDGMDSVFERSSENK